MGCGARLAVSGDAEYHFAGDFHAGHTRHEFRIASLELRANAGDDEPAEELVGIVLAIDNGIIEHFAEGIHGVIQIRFVVGAHRQPSNLLA